MPCELRVKMEVMPHTEPGRLSDRPDHADRVCRWRPAGDDGAGDTASPRFAMIPPRTREPTRLSGRSLHDRHIARCSLSHRADALLNKPRLLWRVIDLRYG